MDTNQGTSIQVLIFKQILKTYIEHLIQSTTAPSHHHQGSGTIAEDEAERLYKVKLGKTKVKQYFPDMTKITELINL